MKGMARLNTARARRVAGVERQENIGSEGSVSVQSDGGRLFLSTGNWLVCQREEKGRVRRSFTMCGIVRQVSGLWHAQGIVALAVLVVISTGNRK
jgi:hypothetical protein